jgi:hypothetical protein
LPISAVTELVAVTVFAANISVSFARRSSAQPVVQVSAKQSV